MRPFSSQQAVEFLEKQSASIRTERGRAWIRMRSADQKLSFPAIIVIDRSNPVAPLLRIEAMDPLGVTHALMLLDSNRNFLSIDFDQRRYFSAQGTWYGLPLDQLPDLLLGLLALPGHHKLEQSDEQGFRVSSDHGRFRYEITWIDPGPRMALKKIDGEIERKAGRKEKYIVEYSKYLDVPDFYLPQEVNLKSYSQASKPEDQPDLEVHIAWRERRWNEEIPAQVFSLSPDFLRGFSKESF
ncbi:MAG: hypothetical protein AB1540_03260 [Bdellovibrionota bacterium]